MLCITIYKFTVLPVNFDAMYNYLQMYILLKC